MKIGSISFSLFYYKSKMNSKGLAPIYCKLSNGTDHVLKSTKVFISEDMWISKNQEIADQSCIEFQLLDIWKKKLLNQLIKLYNDIDHGVPLSLIFTDTKVNEQKETLGWVAACNIYISNMLKLVGTDYTQETYNKFKTLVNNLSIFISDIYQVKDIPINDVKLKHLLEFEQYFKIDKAYKQSTVNKSIQQLKQMMKYAIGHEYANRDPWIHHRSKHVRSSISYLSVSDLGKIANCKTLTDKLARVRDCFIFACNTGLGYAELSTITTNNIIQHNNRPWIKITRKKTGKNVNIPLLPDAEQIWNTYNGKLPIISNQQYNNYLKEIAKHLNIKTNLTSHLARKTFTTTILIGNNIPLKVASALLGHSDSSITEKHYAEVPSELINLHIDRLFKAISKKSNEK